jgi:hypothetical protein
MAHFQRRPRPHAQPEPVEQFVKMPYWLQQRADLDDARKKILALLIDLQRRYGASFASWKKLAQLGGYKGHPGNAKKNVKRLVLKLQQELPGVITIKPLPRQANHIIVNVGVLQHTYAIRPGAPDESGGGGAGGGAVGAQSGGASAPPHGGAGAPIVGALGPPPGGALAPPYQTSVTIPITNGPPAAGAAAPGLFEPRPTYQLWTVWQNSRREDAGKPPGQIVAEAFARGEIAFAVEKHTRRPRLLRAVHALPDGGVQVVVHVDGGLVGVTDTDTFDYPASYVGGMLFGRPS